MDLKKIIKDSISELKTTGSCSSNVDDVEVSLAKKGIYGNRYIIEDCSGVSLTRINHDGIKKRCSWHEVYVLDSENLVIDLDSPEQIYRKDLYFKKCLITPKDPIFAHLEES